MKTPKEKAEELYNKFDTFTIDYDDNKRIALICVDEILKLHMWKHNSVELYKFWKEVKQEIEQL